MAPIRPATRWRGGRHSTWFATPTKGRNPVTALTNEVDEVALQCVINKTKQDGILWLPSGLLYLTKPNISGELALVVRGAAGREATTLLRLFGGRTAGITGRRKPALDWWHQFSDLRLTLQCARGYPDLWGLGQSAEPLRLRRSDQSRFQPGNGRFHAVRHQHRREGLSP